MGRVKWGPVAVLRPERRSGGGSGGARRDRAREPGRYTERRRELTGLHGLRRRRGRRRQSPVRRRRFRGAGFVPAAALRARAGGLLDRPRQRGRSGGGRRVAAPRADRLFLVVHVAVLLRRRRPGPDAVLVDGGRRVVVVVARLKK